MNLCEVWNDVACSDRRRRTIAANSLGRARSRRCHMPTPALRYRDGQFVECSTMFSAHQIVMGRTSRSLAVLPDMVHVGLKQLSDGSRRSLPALGSGRV